MKRGSQVFISHSARDRKAAQRVAAALKEEGFQVWWDEDAIPAGSNWAEEIAQALNRSEAIVILISPDLMSSDYAKKEIDFALSGEKFNRRVIPVLLKPTSGVPWILERLKVIDATRDLDKATQQIVGTLGELPEVSKR